MKLLLMSLFRVGCVALNKGSGGRDSAYERGGDACRLTKGVLGKTPSYLAVKVSFRVAREKI